MSVIERVKHTSDLVIDILTEESQAGCEFAKILLKMRKAVLADDIELRIVLKQADAYKIQSRSVEEIIFFIYLKCTLLLGNISERIKINQMLNYANSIVENKTHPILKFLLKQLEVLITDNLNLYINLNSTEPLKHYEQSPRYFYFYFNYLLIESQAGCLKESKVDAHIEFLSKDKGFKPYLIIAVRFINAVEKHNINLAKELLASYLAADKEEDAIVSDIVSIYIQMLDFIENPERQIINKSTETSKLILCNQSLLSGNQNTLNIEYFKLNRQTQTLTNNFFQLTELRYELSNKNIQASIAAFKIKQQRHTHYLDLFFQARIERLKGNLKKAEGLLAKVFISSQEYDANNRLAWEWSVSNELSKGQVFNLCQSAFSISKQGDKGTKLETEESFEILKTPKTFLVGRSKNTIKLKATIEQFSQKNITILISGETGVGKDLIAKSIHESSNVKEEPYIPVNCSALSESLASSELFGHAQGAFTGATKKRQGLFASAGKGIVFLDEIGDAPLAIQASLLRVLESKEILPVGSSKVEKCHCRIIAATNADLRDLVKLGKFREDLYYRLNSLEINVEPLRARKEDILPLCEHYLSIGRIDDAVPVLEDDLQQLLINYEWPGNVRELVNLMNKLRIIHSEKLNYRLSDIPKDSPLHANNKVTIDLEQNNKNYNTGNDDFISSVSHLFDSNKNSERRLERIKEIFLKFKRAQRVDLMKALEVTAPTITSDLNKLINLGFIQKVTPTPSPRTHYFVLIEK